MDTLDLFSAEPEQFGGSLWLYQSTKGVVAFGPQHETVEAAEDRLRQWTQLPLEFVPAPVTPEAMYKDRRNVAVVTSHKSGATVSHAPISDNWYPPGDPRRKP